MDFEWHEPKRLSNLVKHFLDFLDAYLLFSSPYIVADLGIIKGEHRWMATGMIDDVHVTVIYTMRGDVIRIISLRKARDGERKRYQTLFNSGT
jgi:uncharacterized DUF497 family protein